MNELVEDLSLLNIEEESISSSELIKPFKSLSQ